MKNLRVGIKSGCSLFLSLLLLMLAVVQFSAAGESISLTPDDVNGKFAALDKEFHGRAVTPDMFKTSTDPDDTDAVQDAFDSGLPVVFIRNYQVRSVVIGGVNQQIDFNGYCLEGITSFSDSNADKDCILQISGTYLNLYNVKVDGRFNTNYKYAVHWCTRPGYNAAQYNKIYGLQIKNAIVGMLFGSDLDNPTPLDAPQSENNIYSFETENVQKGILLYQPNGFLKITGGRIEVGKGDWETSANSHAYNAEDEICVYDKFTSLTLESCDLVKKTTAGYGFRGKMLYLSNCNIDVAGTWGLVEGDIHISDTKLGKQQAAASSLFQIARNAEGQLIIEGSCVERAAGAAASEAYLVDGLTRAPAVFVTIKNSNFSEWDYARLAPAEDRKQIFVEDTYFYADGAYSLVDDRAAEENAGSSVYAVTNLAANVDVTGEFMTNEADNSPKSGWTIFEVGGAHGAYFSRGTADLPQGYGSYIDYRDAEGSSYITSNYFPVTPGEALLAKGMFKHQSLAPDSRALVTWYDSSNTYLGAEVLFMGQEVEADTWTEIVKELTVPAQAVRARFQICVGQGYLLSTGLALYPAREDYANSFLNQLNSALSAYPSSGTGDSTGLILVSPNGTRFKVFVDAQGAFQTTPLDEAAPAVTAPTITGPASMTLQTGYEAVSTEAYTVAGTAPVTVTKVSGNEKITWDGTAKKLNIAEGLAAGSYEVTLRASNGAEPDADLVFTLTVEKAPADKITLDSNDSSMGSVTAADGKEGAVTVAIKAREGYVLTDVKVDGVSVGAVASYTFTDGMAHTLYAEFAPKIGSTPSTGEETGSAPSTGGETKSTSSTGEETESTPSTGEADNPGLYLLTGGAALLASGCVIFASVGPRRRIPGENSRR